MRSYAHPRANRRQGITLPIEPDRFGDLLFV
jgi:hypothetical protein